MSGHNPNAVDVIAANPNASKKMVTGAFPHHADHLPDPDPAGANRGEQQVASLISAARLASSYVIHSPRSPARVV